MKSNVDRLVELLTDRKLTITTAESCTGGMISSTIVNVPGASSVFSEAYVTYSNEAKERLIGVPMELIERCGAVSYEVAYKMAEGAAIKANADCAISVTGIAGPDGGTVEKPVGTVYAGFYYKGIVEVIRYNFSGNRLSNRESTVVTVIDKFIQMLENVNN